MLIEWVPDSSVGKVPSGKIKSYLKLTKGVVADPDYLDELKNCHGGIPVNHCFTDRKRRKHRLGRFINFLNRSTIRGPLQPSFMDPQGDQRLWWSYGGLMSIANIGCGIGEHLVPFALLCSGKNHSDDMDPTHLDMLCFNYVEGKTSHPSVVYWVNHLACDEYFRCENEGLEAYTSINLTAFTVRVADSFREFASLLKAR
jgi:hypothetical protein